MQEVENLPRKFLFQRIVQDEQILAREIIKALISLSVPAIAVPPMLKICKGKAQKQGEYLQKRIIFWGVLVALESLIPKDPSL